MTHVTCRLTAKNRDQLRNPTLGNRVWATFTFYLLDVLDDDFREGQVYRWGGKLSYFRRRGSVHRSDVAYDQQAGRLGGAALKAITAGSPGHCRDTAGAGCRAGTLPGHEPRHGSGHGPGRAGGSGHCQDTVGTLSGHGLGHGRDTAGASWRDRDGQISPE